MSDPTADNSKSPFPSVRRVVTGHTPSGESTVIRDEIQSPQFWSPGSRNAVHDLFRTNETPAVNDAELSSEGWVDSVASHPGPAGLLSKNGSTFRSFDYAPGSFSPFHRTQSLDYAIVTKGTLVLELDNGKRIELKEGDTVVQRGSIHAWRNESTEWARVYFIVLDALPISVDGEKLPEEWRKLTA